MECNLCASETSPHGSTLLLRKHRVQYVRCKSCGFIQTETPFWLEEAYGETMTASDVGLVWRNLLFSRLTSAVISCFFRPEAKFLDYGGGYGLLSRLMRDAGYDFYWHDPKCANLFARGFEASEANVERFEVLTAFEVFEHLPRPLEEAEKMLRFSRNILFSTELLPAVPPPPGQWWYYAPEHGQHVSFYALSSLEAMAKRLGLRLYSNRRSLHLLTEKKISPLLFRLLSRHPVAVLINLFRRRRSLLEADYEKAVQTGWAGSKKDGSPG